MQPDTAAAFKRRLFYFGKYGYVYMIHRMTIITLYRVKDHGSL